MTFPYVQVVPGIGAAGWMPFLPVVLTHNGHSLTEQALVDSGAAVNVIPYPLGLKLGGDWNQFGASIPVGGLLANHPAKPLQLDLTIGTFPAVQMNFIWSRSPAARLILGQTNFFLEFDICFSGSKHEFQIQPRTP
jgi:hypothetical protein